MEWNEDLHRKLQELKAATNPAAQKRLVEEAIALAKRGPQRARLDAIATNGCKVSLETYNAY